MTRRRWVYTEGGRPLPEPVEVGEDFRNTLGLTAPFTDSYMDGTVATDGTDIGSRKKRAAYMKANGLVDADDFKGTWAKAAKERAEARAGTSPQHRAQVREALGRALYQLDKRKPR